MLSKAQFTRLKPLFIFFVAYTVIFYIFTVTFKYTFPFIAGFLLALLIQPVTGWLKKRLRFPRGAAAAAATVFIYIILFGLLFLLGYWLINEISQLIARISEVTSSQMESVAAPLNNWIEKLGKAMKNMNQDFIKENQEKIFDIFKTGMNVLTKVLSGVLRFLTSIPAIFTMLLVMVVSTYFFSKDMESIKRFMAGFFTKGGGNGMRSITQQSKSMGGKYIGSYLLIYFITFVETLIVFLAAGVPYPLVLAIITGVADILPVLGPGTIYIPLSLVYFFKGDVFRAVALIVCWFIITAIRQIIEPKIVSSSINIHPLTMLAAIYFALVAGNFWILIYFSVLLILYKVLTQLGYLPHIFAEETDKEPGAGEAGGR